MTITRINPDQLHQPPGYHHVTVVESRRLLFLAGRRFIASPISPALSTASTLTGVAQLGFRGQLVELELTAAVDP